MAMTMNGEYQLLGAGPARMWEKLNDPGGAEGLHSWVVKELDEDRRHRLSGHRHHQDRPGQGEVQRQRHVVGYRPAQRLQDFRPGRRRRRGFAKGGAVVKLAPKRRRHVADLVEAHDRRQALAQVGPAPDQRRCQESRRRFFSRTSPTAGPASRSSCVTYPACMTHLGPPRDDWTGRPDSHPPNALYWTGVGG